MLISIRVLQLGFFGIRSLPTKAAAANLPSYISTSTSTSASSSALFVKPQQQHQQQLSNNKNTISMSSALTSIDKGGKYNRKESKHRHIIQSDSDTFPPEANRYHVHVALACPWACGVLAMIKLKGLDHIISHSVTHPTWGKTKVDDEDDTHCGWIFKSPGDDPFPNPVGHGLFKCDDALIPDMITNCQSVREIYELEGDTTGPFTTPLLFDKTTNMIVNNESTDILKMIHSEFNQFAKNDTMDLYPSELQDMLQELNDTLIYPKVNNGVYKCGFARTQEAYDVAVTELFEALEELEERLSKSRYLGGNDTFTWLDLRLFMTLVRFDPVYITYFKTNQKRLVDYPNLLGFVRDVYSMDAVKACINMDHIKTHYFTSHPVHNTFGIVPIYDGPDLNVPHGRDTLFKRGGKHRLFC